ncbi:MAG: hypothetical protein A2X94_06735 [Bdellovibrionales bacterium GWB1_55_8]|nr:MAG: hypothetical protein A2X94_06735 [Bdellovibrionales bacterium GWB1_55_8]
MKAHHLLTAAIVIISLSSFPERAQALEQIIRPYQNARSSGMGGVKITTGFYDENFFGNPARVTHNPKFRLSLLEPTFEINPNSISTVSDLAGADDILQTLGDTAGRSNHVRVQTVFPSIYIPTNNGARMSYAFGVIMNSQGDVALRRSFQVNPQAVVDIGPALTIGRRFLANDALSVGLTSHLIYRAAARTNLSLGDLLEDSSMSPERIGGDGAMVDFDLGATYELPWIWKDFQFLTGAAINNVLGGKYSNLNLQVIDNTAGALEQPRTLGLGITARRAKLGPFRDFQTAFEITDIGNNDGGSLFRLIHIGAEAHYGVLAPRLGINQGYLTGGLGLNTRFFSLDYAYYGEELTLNAGGYEDRRHIVKIAFHI